MGHPHSDALHIVERMKRIAHDIFRSISPSTIRRPIRSPGMEKRVFQLAKGAKAVILEDILCEDHLTNDHVPRMLRGEFEAVDKAP